MAKTISPLTLVLFLLLSSISLTLATDYPLFTKSRWIVNKKGHRVKLACANWPSHLKPVVAEGLSSQPMDSISKKIKDMGFNCVRLTWPLELMINDTLAFNVTVKQSFERYGLDHELQGIYTHNPSIVNIPLINAFQAVVYSLGRHDVMVILDNHKTVPGWCCSNNDPDAFFGDPKFNPDLWMLGLKKMATIFMNVNNVVGMSLRNELRGYNHTAKDWYKYMQKGAEAVHTSNPNVLVILSGLNFDADLSFLQDRPVNLSFKKKLVLELHWYSFTDGTGQWKSHNVNDFCSQMFAKEHRTGGFVLEQGFPLFLSEFGTDQRGGDFEGNRYMSCMLAWAAEKDIDWAVWALTGVYYFREGKRGVLEAYGMLDANWHNVHNYTYLRRLSVIQPPHKGPGIKHNHHKKIFHPLTGLCLVRKSSCYESELMLGPCTKGEPWSYSHGGILEIKGGHKSCLEGETAVGRSVKLGKKCTKIMQISATKMHLSLKTNDGSLVCLDVDSDNNVVANSCKCLTGDITCEPASQWFKIF
ncbi:glycosyl hydrolase family 5 protein [Arabidopsis lyrata subsp. lyrata]|uniref:Glycosyl hydrolase family 5 protein n=2 Tax=Arabidopsis lyrata subsp. lyrata TaxID=81972 RepID=D7LX14_ARALL|nr:glycosyl hydrolase family 5 protein [Arabidopsis lyrata subsp. lyrata]